MENVVITQDHRAVAVLLLDEQHPGDEATLAALERRWQEVLALARPQYEMTGETVIPNAKPQIVEDAIQRDVWKPIGHDLHPDDPSGRTALCGVKILGVPTFGEFVVCADCRTLRMAQGRTASRVDDTRQRRWRRREEADQAMEPEHETLPWQIFTDGASSPDGRGGWAYVVVKDGIEVTRQHGSALGVTHQRMEIRAVAEALLAFPRDVPVQVIGDSAYTYDCFLKEWHVRWEQNGWRNSTGKPVSNRDEWERLLAAWRARKAETKWRRIPGHAKGEHPWNELADRLAVEAKALLVTRPG